MLARLGAAPEWMALCQLLTAIICIRSLSLSLTRFPSLSPSLSLSLVPSLRQHPLLPPANPLRPPRPIFCFIGLTLINMRVN